MFNFFMNNFNALKLDITSEYRFHVYTPRINN